MGRGDIGRVIAEGGVAKREVGSRGAKCRFEMEWGLVP